MSRIRGTINSFRARLHPDEIAREVETELRFHVEMRTRANLEAGMTPDQANRAALQSFGDFDQVKSSCCEIRRSLPFNTSLLKMGLHITIAVVAGLGALWAVNVPHHTFTGVMRQLIAIGVLGYLFIVVRRAKSRVALGGLSEAFRADQSLTSDMTGASAAKITAYDEQGSTPVERVFKSE